MQNNDLIIWHTMRKQGRTILRTWRIYTLGLVEVSWQMSARRN